MQRILYIVTHGMSARHLLKGQLGWLRDAGLDVAVAASPGPDLEAVAAEDGIEVFPIPMQREISPLADLRSLSKLIQLMRRWRPDVVNASTPKAGLLGMLAARVARVPRRIYMLRGLRLETAVGKRRRLLMATERTASRCAHKVIAVSPSLAERYVELGLALAEKVQTLGAGSSNGVDFARYQLGEGSSETLRKELGLPPDAVVFGFVGRLTRDKGIVELVEAFEQVQKVIPHAHLHLVGDLEAGDPVPAETEQRIRAQAGISLTGFVNGVERHYHVMDLLVSPSYREGFPNAPLEAAAAGVPVVGSKATGMVDAVVDEETGLLVDVGDVEGLAQAMLRYGQDPQLRKRHGAAARERARVEFRPERIWTELLRVYRDEKSAEIATESSEKTEGQPRVGSARQDSALCASIKP